MSERFYINWPLATGPVELTGPEAHHLATVCRLRAGDRICLFNGDGREYPARVSSVARRSVSLEIDDVISPNRELPFHLEIAAALPKGDRAQFLVEKLTELGVKTFVPLICQRSVVHPGDGKLEKLRRFVIEASKQCGRNVLMEVLEPVNWESYSGRYESGEMRLVAHPINIGELTFRHDVARVRCAVGPEGGLTDEEVALALVHGWRMVDLGPRILRVETAAVALAALVEYRLKPLLTAPVPD